MTFKYKNVYIDSSSLIGGKYEQEGPLKQYFDKTYDEFYFRYHPRCGNRHRQYYSGCQWRHHDGDHGNL